jgi:undecaprenyl-diphosphatase
VDPIGTTGIWRRVDLLEQSICVRANRGCRFAACRSFFSTVSRLGDGPLWYLVMLTLAVSGPANAQVAAQMAVAGIAGLGLYKMLKHRLVRERPYISHERISLGTAPLDRYSFPSGHTLHAVAFTQIATVHVPELAPVLVPFAALIAASRVVLGLHYPTDVLAGAVIGSLLASATLAAWPV